MSVEEKIYRKNQSLPLAILLISLAIAAVCVWALFQDKETLRRAMGLKAHVSLFGPIVVFLTISIMLVVLMSILLRAGNINFVLNNDGLTYKELWVTTYFPWNEILRIGHVSFPMPRGPDQHRVAIYLRNSEKHHAQLSIVGKLLIGTNVPGRIFPGTPLLINPSRLEISIFQLIPELNAYLEEIGKIETR